MKYIQQAGRLEPQTKVASAVLSLKSVGQVIRLETQARSLYYSLEVEFFLSQGNFSLLLFN